MCIFELSYQQYLMREYLCVSQLFAQRNVSTDAACLLIHASVSLDGVGLTAPVVSALYS